MNAIDTWNPPGKNGKPQGNKGGDAFLLALATGLSGPRAAKRAGIGTAVHEELRQIGLLGLILIKVSVVVFGFILKLRILELRILRLQRR